ncbi:MAG: hypothetical protein AAGI48_17020 [Verrucomicrobiota bacterium]
MIIFFSLIPPLLVFTWLLVIRPYCLQNGQGYTPGITWFSTMWIDWQMGSEVARAKGDQGMVVLCRIFVILGALFIFLPYLFTLLSVAVGALMFSMGF